MCNTRHYIADCMLFFGFGLVRFWKVSETGNRDKKVIYVVYKGFCALKKFPKVIASIGNFRIFVAENNSQTQ